MQAWLFKGVNGYLALSAERTGAELPAEHGPWRVLRHVTLDHDDPDEEEARTLIREHGYCCFVVGEQD